MVPPNSQHRPHRPPHPPQHVPPSPHASYPSSPYARPPYQPPASPAYPQTPPLPQIISADTQRPAAYSKSTKWSFGKALVSFFFLICMVCIIAGIVYLVADIFGFQVLKKLYGFDNFASKLGLKS